MVGCQHEQRAAQAPAQALKELAFEDGQKGVNFSLGLHGAGTMPMTDRINLVVIQEDVSRALAFGQRLRQIDQPLRQRFERLHGRAGQHMVRVG